MANDAKIVITAEDRASRVLGAIKGNVSGVETQVTALRSAFATIGGAFVVRELSRIASSAIAVAGDLSVLSEKTGLSVRDLSALKFAVVQGNVSFEAFAVGLKHLAVNSREAARGAAEQRDAFADIGVSVLNSEGKLRGLNDLLPEIADSFSSMPDGVEKTALAVKLFGRAGEDLIPLLNGGSAGLSEMRKEAERLGVVIGDDLANNSRTADDSLDRLKSVAEAAATKIGAGMAPAISDLALALSEVIRNGDGLSTVGAKIGGVLRGIASAAVGASTSVKVFGNSLGAVLAIQDRAVRGDFKGALSIFSSASTDTDRILQDGARQIAALKGISQSAQKEDDKAKQETLTKERAFGSALRDVKAQELGQLKAILTAQVDAYKDAESEMNAVRQNRIAAEKAAAEFMAKLTTATRASGAAPSNLEVAQDIQKARQLLAAGGKDEFGLQRTAQALEQLKQAREVLLQLKDAGTSQDFLTSQAREISQIEQSVIAVQEAEAQARKDAITKSFDEVLAKAQALAKIKVGFDDATLATDAEKVRRLLEEKLAASPILVPVVPVPSNASDLPSLLSKSGDSPGVYGSDAQGTYYNLAKLPTRSDGGPIVGPGGPRDDSVLMWGSAGEYVQPYSAVAHYGTAFMEAIRTLKLPRFASGGPIVPTMRNVAQVGGGDTINLSLNGYGPFPLSSAPDVTASLQRVLSREALKRGSRA